MAHTICLVCVFITVNGCSKKIEKSLGSGGANSEHITNLKQSISFILISMEQSDSLDLYREQTNKHCPLYNRISVLTKKNKLQY
jgi:hypothetical protein